MCLRIKQLRIDVPAGTIQSTHQLLVRDAHSAAESVLPSSACTAIYGVMPHVHISNTPSSTIVIVELDELLASKQVRVAIGRTFTSCFGFRYGRKLKKNDFRSVSVETGDS